MYTKIPYKPLRFESKKHVIRYLKSSPSKRIRGYHNDTEWVRYLLKANEYYAVSKVKLGVYIPTYSSGDLMNIDNDFTKPTEDFFDLESGNSYGVCDGSQNFLRVFNEELSAMPEKVFVVLTPIHKKDQPKYGGWRWHKWGTYIGRHQITSEYLYDEEGIDTVWLYQIFTIKEKDYGKI